MHSSKQIRNDFLTFFESKSHKLVQSAPVVPFEDPTLLFTNAGMNQFKDIFLGKGHRDYTRAVDTQKCIRVSGKHNDLEEVGYDTYHHTFFEMLGNWSFGDYYKKEAIQWAWELLTEVWKLPKDRLFATVYKDDDEAFEIWKTETDIGEDRILRFGEKDNFWEMGETGPCGPCSEIHFDHTPDKSGKPLVNAGVADVIEIWNLVFIQNNRQSDGSLEPLPATHVDTGMGLERIVAVLQNKKSNYDTDVFTPIINKISEISGLPYELEHQIPFRVIADHIRAISFSIADGVIPSNEGRGYVIRRILRRAARYGRKLGLNRPFLNQLVDTLAEEMGGIFPEINERKNHVKKVILSEEESFSLALDRGIQLFDQVMEQLSDKKEKVFSGEDAFKLYDTYGFPFDLTRLMAEENGFTVDGDTFNQLMEAQRQRARNAGKFTLASEEELPWQEVSSGHHSDFKGYESIIVENASIREVRRGLNFTEVVLDSTPFYAESGGQVGDNGYFEIKGNKFPVIDTQRIDNRIVHFLESFPYDSSDDKIKAVVNLTDRLNTARNHTATHLLHAALRKVLGTHVKQAGSLVAPDRLRFDFSHYEKVTDEQVGQIENLVREQIKKAQDLKIQQMSFSQSQQEGAVAFFGDKYGDEVRVITIGSFSKELCGGTHLNNTSEIGNFRIVSESSIAAGVRRIEAVSGDIADEIIETERRSILELKKALNLTQADEIPDQVKFMVQTIKRLEKELHQVRLQLSMVKLNDMVASAKTIGDYHLVIGKTDAHDMNELKNIGNQIKSKLKPQSIVILASQVDDKAQLLAMLTDDLKNHNKLHAGKIISHLAKIVGGGGGGQSHIATAGGKLPEKLDEALNVSFDLIKEMLD